MPERGGCETPGSSLFDQGSVTGTCCSSRLVSVAGVSATRMLQGRSPDAQRDIAKLLPEHGELLECVEGVDGGDGGTRGRVFSKGKRKEEEKSGRFNTLSAYPCITRAFQGPDPALVGRPDMLPTSCTGESRNLVRRASTSRALLCSRTKSDKARIGGMWTSLLRYLQNAYHPVHLGHMF